MKSLRWWRIGMLLALAGILLGLGGWGPVLAAKTSLGPGVGIAERMDLSFSLREMAPAVMQTVVPSRLENPLGGSGAWFRFAMPTPLTSFAGINNRYGAAESSISGDIGYDPSTGKKYYVQWVNFGMEIWDVTQGSPVVVLGPVAGNLIWRGFGGPCESDNYGNPVVLFDSRAQRWFLAQSAGLSNSYYQCLAVSQTADPAGSWYRYAFNTGAKFSESPRWGAWTDAYYMASDQTDSGNNWAGGAVYAFNRDELLAGDPEARYVYFDLEGVSGNYQHLLPADLDGIQTPAAGSAAYFAAISNATALGALDSLQLWSFSVDWNHPENATFGSNGQPNMFLPVTDFAPLCPETLNCIPQPVAQKLAGSGDRLMSRLAYRNFGGYESLVLNHSVDVLSGDGSRAGIRWYELRKSGELWEVYQYNTYAPLDSSQRWLGSIAQDRLGNMALGFNVSSESIYPSIRYVGRLVGDDWGAMAQAETSLFTGSAAQIGNHAWGPVSILNVDPQDDCTFWYSQQYSLGDLNWGTRIGAFRFDGCLAAETRGALTGTLHIAGSDRPLVGARVVAWGDNGARWEALSNTVGEYRLQIPGGVYTLTTRPYGFDTSASVAIVTVTAGMTTSQDFFLPVQETAVISGVVRDAESNWPLYARVVVESAGDGVDPSWHAVWTDPATGSYSLTLARGISYTLSVTSWISGYQPISQAFMLSEDQIFNAGLSIVAGQCELPGYHLTGAWIEDFEAVEPPALPEDWAMTRVVTTTPRAGWATHAGTRNPAGIAAHSGANLVYFNSFDAGSSGAARLYYESGIDMTTVNVPTVSFWMYHDTGLSPSDDQVQVQISVDGGFSWHNVGYPILRYDGTTAWKKHTLDLTAYTGIADLRLGFLGTSFYGNDVHIDDVTVGEMSCQPQAGGWVVGHVYDANTQALLTDAVVTDGVALTMEDGVYALFAPTGTVVLTATMGDLYQPQTISETVVLDQVTPHDFYLESGRLVMQPAAFDVELQPSQQSSFWLGLHNAGGQPLAVNLFKTAQGLSFLQPGGVFEHRGRYLSPQLFELPSLSAISYYSEPTAELPSIPGGAVVLSWTTGLANAWGVAYDAHQEQLWVGNPLGGATAGDDRNYQFGMNGSQTAFSMTTASWRGRWAGDMAYDSLARKLWQINVGGDNCVYELDPLTGSTGHKICPAFGSSQRGLAYDPTTDTFFAGSWNDGVIYRFTRAGELIEEAALNLPISGLAYASKSGHLFVAVHGPEALYKDIYVVDVNNGYALLGGFDLTGMDDFAQAGLDLDCTGRLWAVNSKTGWMLAASSGESTVCGAPNASWVTVTPSTVESIAAGETISVAVGFNSASLLPGVYRAYLSAVSGTPYKAGVVPVTLTVNAPGLATVAGVVRSRGYCDAQSAPLGGAEVLIQDHNGLSTTLQTAADGSYHLGVDPASGPLTVTVTAANHESRLMTGVNVTSQVTVTADFNLRLLRPCVHTVQDPLLVTLMTGGSTSHVVTVTNQGGAASTLNMSAENAPWLSFVPTQTLVTADGVVSVTLNFTAWPTVTPDMTYTTAIQIQSQDPVSPVLTIPVTFVVQAIPVYRVYLPVTMKEK